MPGSHLGRWEKPMKALKWTAVLGVVAIGVILYLGKDDLVRYKRMREM